MLDRRPFTITQLSDEHGYWTARVTIGGVAHLVDRKHGSWRVQEGLCFREVAPAVAVALQDKVRRIERATKRATGVETRAAA